MSNSNFTNRVYGCVIVKAINANYNADFNGLPRRLKSDGNFYATDKSFKWLIRNYIMKNYDAEKILFTKHYDDKQNTMKLKEAFEKLTSYSTKDNMKDEILPKLLDFIDVKLFGAAFTPEGTRDNNISLHGVVQISHAMDIYKKGKVYTDEILAPFTAIGSMSKATEAHYIHNFSVNPKNLLNIAKEDKKDTKYLTHKDIAILKNAFNNAATFYDSHSKSGVENELSIYVTLNEDSELVLPSFSQFIDFKKGKDGEKNSFDLSRLISFLNKYDSQIESIEIYCIDELTELKYNMPDNMEIIKCDLLQILDIQDETN